MIELNEWEQVIYVDKSKELTKAQIQYALYEARKHHRYAKFYCGKYYISIAFNYDLTVQFSTNYRYNSGFSRELNRMEGYKYQQATVTNFIYYWMNRIRRS